MAFTSYSVDNDKRFRDALEKAEKAVGDLTIPLTLISKDFYRSERAIFNLKGPGQYPDFKTKASRAQKIREVGFDYPLLVRTGMLKKSMLDPTDSNAINTIVNKRTLVLGTRAKNREGVLYPEFHQSDAPPRKIPRKIPLRKFLFIGPEARQFATSDQMGRLQRWVGILEGFTKAVSKPFAETK